MALISNLGRMSIICADFLKMRDFGRCLEC